MSRAQPQHKDFDPWLMILRALWSGFLRRAPRHLFFTGKGGVGKTSLACASAVLLADFGPAGTDREYGPGLEPRRRSRHAAGLASDSRDRGHRTRSNEHQSRAGRARLSRAHGRALSRCVVGGGSGALERAPLGRLHRGSRRLRRVCLAPERSQGNRGLRPCDLRHRPHGPYVAAAGIARGLDRIH